MDAMTGNTGTNHSPLNGNAPTTTNKYFEGIDLTQPQVNTDWDAQKSAELYGIDTWGAGYFSINKKGNVCVTPRGKYGPQLDLKHLMEELMERGIRPPILVRFPDIIRARIEILANCFAKAIADYGYQGTYNGVYPIKVNQEKHIVSEIVKHGKKTKLGLECGSKPELLIALGMMEDSDGLCIANGFKDREYIETALLSQKLGRETIIVVDRFTELDEIIKCSQDLQMTPKLGFRVKLDSRGFGKWVDSSGAKSKFGLTSPEMVEGIQKLKDANLIDSLVLLHFHIGSQVSNIQAFKTTLKEGVRFYAEMINMGVNIKYVDVGGGLGVDYDGTGKSDNSVNYNEQEYANDVVYALKEICDQKNLPHPNIVTESGRSLVAHHSILVFNVLGVNELNDEKHMFTPLASDHAIIKDLFEIYQRVNKDNVQECYHDVLQLKNDVLQLFSYGYLGLEQRSKAERLIWSAMSKMLTITKDNEDYTEIFTALSQELHDTYYCNFSVFQSVPDSWAVDQLFPVMPIHRLNEKPTKNAVLVDLTCDSDGKIDKFVSNNEVSSSLPVHSYNSQEPYFLCTFLLGAYQEILGDLHNLFGDTDSVQINIHETGYTLEHFEEGDTVTDVLNYVEYSRTELLGKMRTSIERAITTKNLSRADAKLLMKNYEDGISGYTYLE
jgi:arginine decarboxylase